MATNMTFIDYQTIIPADWLNNVNTVVNALTIPIASSIVTYVLAATGAVSRTLTSKEGDRVSVKDFGALGNGSNNDTTAIQAADTYARSIGAQLYFPAGNYMVSQLIFYTGSNWLGDGRNATTITQIIGSNTDLLYGNNSNANWGSSAPTLIVNGCTLQGLTLNGNWNTGSGNTSGNGISFYGARPIFRDIFITNIANHGMRTEYTDGSAGGDDTFTMEGHFENIRIDTTGYHGWWNNGPHDSVMIDVIIVDAGQATTNTWDGFYFDSKCTGRIVSCHAWTRGASNRMRYAGNFQPGCQMEVTGGTNFEGAYSAVVGIFTSNCIFDASTRYYAAWNGITIYMGKTATTNIIKGWCGGPGAGTPATIGLYLGSTTGDYIANNNIELLMEAQESQNVHFSPYDGGNNIIRINAFNASAANFGGVPATTDDFELRLQNSGGTSFFSNRHQKTSLALAANRTVTWTYQFPFNGSPNVTYAARAPSGNMTVPLWTTTLSSTAVTINNNNGVSLTVDINADAVN